MPDNTNVADESPEATSDETAPKAAKKKTTKKKSTTKKATGSKRASKSTSRAKTAAAGGGTLRVRQIRSTIHKKKTFLRTLVALGIKHHQDEVVVKDTPAIRGMLKKVHHLVRVTPEES